MYKFIVIDGDEIIQEREYHTANECCNGLEKAVGYYKSKFQRVKIMMHDKKGNLIYKIEL